MIHRATRQKRGKGKGGNHETIQGLRQKMADGMARKVTPETALKRAVKDYAGYIGLRLWAIIGGLHWALQGQTHSH